VSTVPAAPSARLTIGRQGHYAGAVSRLAAFAADVAISWGLFTAGVALLSVATELFIGQKVTLTHHQILAIIAVTIWEFVYFTYSWGVSGKTLGMALLGLQVVTAGPRMSAPRDEGLCLQQLPRLSSLADLVVVDGPSLAGDDDAVLAASVTDGAILVARLRPWQADAGLGILENSRVRVIGTVLTEVSLAKPGAKPGTGSAQPPAHSEEESPADVLPPRA